MKLFAGLLDLLFPPRCALCGKRGVNGLCASCAEAAAQMADNAVHRRGSVACLAPLKYEGAVREALLAFKFHGEKSRRAGFGAILAQAVAEQYGGAFDLVSFVPVSEKRRAARGYDQSELLAQEMCRLWDTEPIALLKKTADNRAQSSLADHSARSENVRGVYQAIHEDKIRGARILLVDDILTSGATLGECARVLRAAGAECVLCAAVAAAGEDKPRNAEVSS